MGSRLQIEGDESVLLRVTHSNLKSFASDVRFSLQKKCGTSVNSMCLELYDDMGAKISDMSGNLRPLGFYSPQDGHKAHKTTTRNGGRTKEGDSRDVNESVVQDKPGVYITRTSLPGGVIDLTRVRLRYVCVYSSPNIILIKPSFLCLKYLLESFAIATRYFSMQKDRIEVN
ncbi:Tubulin-folding cofactor B [Camellia lanceoleosa]|uniref:Tubulin-folding cofactor B n=1 Tax=Camellia lanceoleosa TaxID=1840588 RepID=A0ACC0HBE8_9ERIC|nr:Tubulin-folding cofactor B [Camellia lanceoleosa]